MFLSLNWRRRMRIGIILANAALLLPGDQHRAWRPALRAGV
jgi:hypothetical protein